MLLHKAGHKHDAAGHSAGDHIGGQVELKAPALPLPAAHLLVVVKFVLNGGQLDFFAHDNSPFHNNLIEL